MPHRFALFLALACVASAHASDAPDGQIDAGYGSVFGRTVISSFPGLPAPAPYLGAMATSASGKTWLFGEFDAIAATASLPIARLISANGSLDPGFGGGTGLLSTTTFPLGGTWYANLTALVQPDGKPLLAGFMRTAAGDRGFVCRLNVAGNFDATFDTDGCRDFRAFAFTNEDCSIKDIALGAPNGAITFVGQCRDRNSAGRRVFTARLTALGAIDTEFGAGAGVNLPTLVGSELHELNALAMQEDGRFVAVGSTLRATNEYDVAVLQFSNDGTIDPTFANGAGEALRALDIAGTLYDFGTDILVRPDGRILASAFAEGFDNDGEIALWQLNATGLPDASFGANGLVLGSESLVDITNGTPLLGPFYARMRLGIDDLGRAVVAARTGSPVAGSDADVRVFRFTGNGAKDPNFGFAARGIVDIDNDVAVPGPGSSHDIPTAISIERGRIVFGTISIRDEQRHMVTLALTANHLFADSFETN